MARASAGRCRSSSTYACSPAAKASRHGSAASRAAAVARSKWAQARGSRFMSMACHPASAEASARARASCWRFPGRREYRRLVSIWPMWASSLPATAGAPRRRSRSRMLSVSPCRTRTTVASMRPAAVICRSSSASWPEVATGLRGGGAVICRGVSPSRTRAWSGMSRPSAMRSKTWVSRMPRMPLMTSLIRPWPRPTAVPMRIWLSPRYCWSSRNSALMSRWRRAWQTSGRSQKAAGIAGGSNALGRIAFLRSCSAPAPV